ncbi:hypothetical protein [Hymenobacter pini]|uniref:hypothetical protein n=1 Tax=Hymenobacter pini TaxID=2880879 RepID=UPI001CF1C782|nr:hypothetical protein [Hymenobacter pini]MCA8830388.1 hypothetical protein [Hymenobacter pini]
MQAVILYASRNDVLVSFQQLMRRNFQDIVYYKMITPGDFAVERNKDERLYFEYYGLDEFYGIKEYEVEDDEQVLINQHFSAPPHVYSLAYRGIEIIKQVLTVVANSPDYIVNNDCGTQLPGNEFVLTMQQNPGWYWFDDL